MLKFISCRSTLCEICLGKLTTIKKDAKDKDVEAVELYALKGNRDNIAAMSGGVVTDAKDSFDQLGKPLSMQMNGQGAKAGKN
jgi:SecD/SecF fusion protein